jgi:imidazolonepropionase-like amidohydrolase
MTVYPGLIEAFTHAGLDEKSIAYKESTGAPYWNKAVHPQRSAATFYRIDAKSLQRLRESGFTAGLVVPDDGIFAGMGAVVSLGEGMPNEQFIKTEAVHHVKVDRRRDQTYPGSLMGVLALIRQTFHDAQWYRLAHAAFAANPRQAPPEENEALNALQARLPVLMSVDDELTFLRAAAVAKELGLTLWVRGSGHEYRLLDPVKATGAPVILPVTFPQPDRFDVDTPEEAIDISTEDLRHWEAAPENPGRLHRAGVTFALTSDGTDKPETFHARVREAIERGLPYDAALAALTVAPARLLGLEQQLGTIDAGKRAHLTVTDGPLFAENARVRDVWIDGTRYEVTPRPAADPRGTWLITLTPPGAAPLADSLIIEGDVKRLTGSLKHQGTPVKLQHVSILYKRLVMSFMGDAYGYRGMVRVSGSVEDRRIEGQGELADGQALTWVADLVTPYEGKTPDAPAAGATAALPIISPPVSFGRASLPDRPKHVLVRGATVWTLDERGKLDEADMLVTDGKITAIGRDLQAPPDAVVIEAKGKHVTPGLIDAHSHTAISEGINEFTQAVTAEVGIGDVIDSYDIALYRELAGGLTAANVLHGSANPIGGKNQVIKLRWGRSPEGLKFEGAKPGIKFALGENVKRSNSPTPGTRYPQTRMGVEQLIRDRFRAAQEYDRAWKAYNALKDRRGVIPPRQDLELDTLLEILRGERLVHSHSYRQDEILMLIRVADDFGFKIGTFQHVLEGYKVADAIARHGAGASSFSDWWAYKVEAYEAIPYNGALMKEAGVTVTFNSDSNELARRLNTEAAKAVKYGGVSEVEALKFVTLNAARQLQIDNRVGSLEAGKDADFVVWSGHPLSTYTLCEQTWIDGQRYFDRQEDLELRRQVARERALLIQKLLEKKHKVEQKKPET